MRVIIHQLRLLSFNSEYKLGKCQETIRSSFCPITESINCVRLPRMDGHKIEIFDKLERSIIVEAHLKKK